MSVYPQPTSTRARAETPLSVRQDIEHPWQVATELAKRTQSLLAEKVILAPLPARGPGAPRQTAGVDVAYSKDGARAWAAAVLMDPSFRVVDTCVVTGVPDRPYAPGLLAYREGRLTVAALLGLCRAPDVVFVDGHGVVHERGLGLASHVGVLLDVPTVGVPKTPFHAIERLPERERGSFLVLAKEWGAEGAALRLRSGVKPVYVSPGHRTDLATAVDLCLAWSTGRHKVPEPLSAAHTLATCSRQ